MFTISPDEVRALLGLSTEDLEDATINLPIYAEVTAITFSGYTEGIDSKYEELEAKKVAEGVDGLTRPERRFLGVSQVYATHLHARAIGRSMGMFALQKQTDGKAEGNRFNNAHKDTLAALEEMTSNLENTLDELLEGVGLTPEDFPIPIYSAGVGLAVDPVTGE